MGFAAFNGSSASDSVANVAKMGGIMVRNGGGGAVVAVTPPGSINTTVLGTTSFPSCSESGVFVVALVVECIASIALVSNRLMFLGGCAAVMRALLVAGTKSFFRRSFIGRFGCAHGRTV